jgi:hypothetical protein
MVAGVVTVKGWPLLTAPPTAMTMLPVVAPDGTGTTMLVADQLVGVAVVPLNATVLVPFVAPKFEPAMVTTVPTAPLVGDRLLITGAVLLTVNVTALLTMPPTVTTTFPLVAPVGTGTAMLVADQLVGVATLPLNVTVLVLFVVPKFEPAMVTVVPTAPLVGDKLVIAGAVLVTVKVPALLATLPTVTTTFPLVAPVGTGTAMLVADQLVGVAAVPLNVTVLVPFVVPKFEPAIVTGVPMAPVVGDSLVMLGAALATPAAALNAAIPAPQPSLDVIVAVADALPAAERTASSTTSLAELCAGTADSSVKPEPAVTLSPFAVESTPISRSPPVEV